MSLIRTLSGMAAAAAPPGGPSPNFPDNVIDLVGNNSNERLQVASSGGIGPTLDNERYVTLSIFALWDSLLAGSAPNIAYLQWINLTNVAHYIRAEQVTGEIIVSGGDGSTNVNEYTGVNITLGQQHHFIGEWDYVGKTMRCWMDGIQILDATVPGWSGVPPANYGSGGTGLGGEGDASYNRERMMDGYVCQVGVWTKQLTSNERDALANGAYPHTAVTGCVHSWPVDTDSDPLADLAGTEVLLKRGTTTPRATVWPP